MRQEDDDEIIFAEPLPPLVPPGEYDAIIETAKRVERFKRHMLELSFRLVTMGPAFNVRMKGYCSVPKKKGRIPAGSKLAGWMRLLAAFTGGSSSKVALRSFKEYWFRVKVETVTKNYDQQPLRPTDQYSSVVDIVSVVGKSSELNCDPQQEHP